MRHKITARTESVLRELDAATRQIAPALLSVASNEARREWRTLRRQCPSAAELATGVLSLSDDDLAFMAEKVRRFKAILQAQFTSRARRAAPSPELSAAA